MDYECGGVKMTVFEVPGTLFCGSDMHISLHRVSIGRLFFLPTSFATVTELLQTVNVLDDYGTT